MDNKPIVSVIIIIYNAEKFLRETIESVFFQTYGNWELLLIEDGSTDGSVEIAHQYCAAYPEKVRYLEHANHQNRGMSATRNLGIKSALGEYVYFLDADDILSPLALAEQVYEMEAHPEAAMVYGPTYWWYSWNENSPNLKSDFLQTLGTPPDTLIKPPHLLTVFLRQEGSKPCGMLVRRKVFAEVGGFEESFHGMYEDQVFCAKLCLKKPIYVSRQCWYKYRQHQDSCCSIAVSTNQHQTHRHRFLTWLESYLSSQHIQDAEVWQTLRQELWPYRHPFLHRLADYAASFLSR